VRIVYLRALLNLFKSMIRQLSFGDAHLLHAMLADGGLGTIEMLNVKFETFIYLKQNERTATDTNT
jgi:hypothetical protein